MSAEPDGRSQRADGPDMLDPLVGTTIAGRFEVLRRIGEGGMGVVYEARQQPIGRVVALKVLLGSAASNTLAVKRFLNEARIISNLKHPNTVRLIDFGRAEDGRLFIAMEHVGGGSLSGLMEGQRIAQVSALRITRQIAQALAEAHAEGILHRDLKPDNVLLDQVAGEDWVVKVVDFGLAKLNTPGEIELTAPGTRLGTPDYMSPEQAFAKPLGPATDLYSLGIILYRMLTGHLPFQAESSTAMYIAHARERPRSFAAIAPDLKVDPALEALVMGLLEKQPEARPTTAHVARAVDRLLARLAPDAGPIATPAPPCAPPACDDPDPLFSPVARREARVRLVMGACIVALSITVIALLLR